MCKKAMYAAIGKIESALDSDENIIWSGFPDRQVICDKTKIFYWKNVAFFLAAGILATATLFVSPPQEQIILVLIGASVLVRAIGAFFAWSNRKKRINMAYALTNKRLISVNGSNEEMASWYSPSIDTMRVQKCKNTSIFKLRDFELRFSMNFYYVAKGENLKTLLLPYTAQSNATSHEPPLMGNIFAFKKVSTPAADLQEAA